MTLGLLTYSLFTILLIVFLVKNTITYTIQLKWIDEKYDREDWHLVELPAYHHLLVNLKVWKYIPLDEYNEKYK